MRKAAQYVRMSTDVQQHSVDTQVAAMAAYARAHHIEIVQTYLDAGRSGLTLAGRPQLQKLLLDVQAADRCFSLVLVYDVSRWGRFQEVDEAAKYEQLCRDAGAPVIYCAEPFEGTSGITTAVMKAVRRAMAAEQSRDLSEKVKAAMDLASSRGHWTGGPPPFGYQRWAVGPDGKERLLGRRERKGLIGHTVLKPGPEEAVRTVRRMFRLFVEHGRDRSAIARTLTAEGLASPTGGPWSHCVVGRILSSEAYIGALVYKVREQTLGRAAIKRPRSDWRRVPNAFEGIIDEATFRRAQAILAERRPSARAWTDERMLDALTALAATVGTPTRRQIDEARSIPHAHAYIRRFGSLGHALQLAGLPKSHGQPASDARQAIGARRRELTTELGLALHEEGIDVLLSGGDLVLQGWFRVRVCPQAPIKHQSRGTFWEIRRPQTACRYVLGVRLPSIGGEPIDWALLEGRSLARTTRLGPKSTRWLAAPKAATAEDMAAHLRSRLQ